MLRYVVGIELYGVVLVPIDAVLHGIEARVVRAVERHGLRLVVDAADAESIVVWRFIDRALLVPVGIEVATPSYPLRFSRDRWLRESSGRAKRPSRRRMK